MLKKAKCLHLTFSFFSIHCFICIQVRQEFIKKEKNSKQEINALCQQFGLVFETNKFSPAIRCSLPTIQSSLPWRALDRTSTQIMTSPASLFLSAHCSNSSCASRGGWTPAWSLASWMLPGKPRITGQVWRAPVSAGSQPTMKDLCYSQASEMLSCSYFREICETLPDNSKVLIVSFSNFSAFL